MVDCIKQLVNNKSLNIAITKNALEMVKQFDWEVVKKQWINVLK